MSRQGLGARGFADLAVEGRNKGSEKLEKISAIIDFKQLESSLRLRLLTKRGRPSYPDLMMFKALLLQVWYNLSDQALEEALFDRLSFRRFCGFSLEDQTPDAITIGRFRALLGKHVDKLFMKVTEQLDTKGFMLKQGTLVDATLIEADVKRPKGGEISKAEPEAGWGCKKGEYTYGYKAHVGMDEGSGLIRKAALTSADCHDSLGFYECVTGDEGAVYADKAYDNKAFRQNLRVHGIKPRLMHRLYKGDPAQTRKTALNKAYSRVRCSVEKIFGTFKRTYQAGRARYRGFDKNSTWLKLMAIAYNLKRATTLFEQSLRFAG